MNISDLGAATGPGAGLLDGVALRSSGRSRCVNAENPHGEKGRGAMSASGLGPGRKGTPCLGTIPAGGTATLMDVDGPGVIRHIWMTVTDKTSPNGPNVLRNLILEFYWDGEEEPSVVCPIGDFFCCGHAQACRIDSLPIMVAPNRGFNSYFSMPFEHARIVLRNDHNEDVPAFFYQIDYTEYDALSEDALRFHAQWRRERVTTEAHDYTVLDGVRGQGAFVGMYLALTALESRWWGEGEVKMYIDGDEDHPTWTSTGTEDYFGGAWSFSDFGDGAGSSGVTGSAYDHRFGAEGLRGAHCPAPGEMSEQTYCSPFVGFPFYSRSLVGRESRYWDQATPVMRGLYRWHLPDPIYFQHDLRVTLQQIGTDENGLFERSDDVASVAYWYQTEPHTPFPAIGDRHFRQPR